MKQFKYKIQMAIDYFKFLDNNTILESLKTELLS